MNEQIQDIDRKFVREVEPDYKKYISIEWLKEYTRLCCMDYLHENALSFIDTWIKCHEMCCCRIENLKEMDH